MNHTTTLTAGTQPTVSYRLTPNQAISLGVAFVHTHLLLEQSFLNPYDTKPTAIG